MVVRRPEITAPHPRISGRSGRGIRARSSRVTSSVRPSLLLGGLVLALSGVACSAAPSLEGDPGDTSEDAMGAGGCDRQAVTASVSGARRTALERGFKWLDDDVPYSQGRQHEGYRTDCSGFVSMCWDTGTSHTTSIFASGGGDTQALGSWDDLVAGDALVKRGHIMLFTGWSDDARSSVCALEQSSTANDMQFRARSVASLRGQGYKPIRSNKLDDGSTGAPAGEPPPSGEELERTEGEPAVEDPAVVPPPRETAPSPAPPPEEEPRPVRPEVDPRGEPTEAAGGREPASSTAPVVDDTATRTPKKATTKTSDEDDDEEAPTSATVASGGCSVAANGASSGSLSGLGLGFVVLALVRRRRP